MICAPEGDARMRGNSLSLIFRRYLGLIKGLLSDCMTNKGLQREKKVDHFLLCSGFCGFTAKTLPRSAPSLFQHHGQRCVRGCVCLSVCLSPVLKRRLKPCLCHSPAVDLESSEPWVHYKMVIRIPACFQDWGEKSVNRCIIRVLAPCLAQSRYSKYSQFYCPMAQGLARWRTLSPVGAPAICPPQAAAHLLPLCSRSLPY